MAGLVESWACGYADWGQLCASTRCTHARKREIDGEREREKERGREVKVERGREKKQLRTRQKENEREK